MHALKAFHVLIGVSLLGLLAAEYFYLLLASRDEKLLRKTLRFSLAIDAVILLIIIVLFFSGYFLMGHYHFTTHTPWIRAAFILLFLTMLCWLFTVVVKMLNYRNADNQPTFRFHWLFHACYIMMFILIILIIHDAVMKSTFLL